MGQIKNIKLHIVTDIKKPNTSQIEIGTLPTTLPTTVTTFLRNMSGKYSSCEKESVSSAENHTYAVFMIIFLATSLCGNFIVISVVCLSKRFRERSTFYFVASLALSDTMIAAFQIPIRVSMKYHNMSFCFGLPVCYMRLMMDVVGNVASICNLLLISVDRFVAVTFPYRYPAYLSKSRSLVLIFLTWTLAVSWSIIGIIPWNPSSTIAIRRFCVNTNIKYYQASFLGIFIPAQTVMTVLLSKVFFIAVQQSRQIRKLAVSTPSPMTPENPNRTEHRRFSKRTTMVLELKATKSIFIVYIAFIIVWLPCTIIHMLQLFDQSFRMPPKLWKRIWFTFYDVLPVLLTCVNPFIYGFFNKQFCKALQYVRRKLMVKANLTDTYLSREQQTKRIGQTGGSPTIFGNPYAIGSKGRLKVVGVDIIPM